MAFPEATVVVVVDFVVMVVDIVIVVVDIVVVVDAVVLALFVVTDHTVDCI